MADIHAFLVLLLVVSSRQQPDDEEEVPCNLVDTEEQEAKVYKFWNILKIVETVWWK